MFLQEQLSENVSLLVPRLIAFDKFQTALNDIEEMLAGQSETGQSPTDYLKEWLNA